METPYDNSQAWQRLISYVQSQWFDPGDRIEAVLDTVVYLRNNPADVDLLVNFPSQEGLSGN